MYTRIGILYHPSHCNYLYVPIHFTDILKLGKNISLRLLRNLKVGKRRGVNAPFRPLSWGSSGGLVPPAFRGNWPWPWASEIVIVENTIIRGPLTTFIYFWQRFYYHEEVSYHLYKVGGRYSSLAEVINLKKSIGSLGTYLPTPLSFLLIFRLDLIL